MTQLSKEKPIRWQICQFHPSLFSLISSLFLNTNTSKINKYNLFDSSYCSFVSPSYSTPSVSQLRSASQNSINILKYIYNLTLYVHYTPTQHLPAHTTPRSKYLDGQIQSHFVLRSFTHRMMQSWRLEIIYSSSHAISPPPPPPAQTKTPPLSCSERNSLAKMRWRYSQLAMTKRRSESMLQSAPLGVTL